MRETVKKGKYKYDFKISNFKTECYYAPSTLLGVAQKLGQLEDIEEELGIDLITLFKALKNGFYFKDDFGDIVHFEKELLQSLIKGKVQDLKKELKDYGKTWALTKEELL